MDISQHLNHSIFSDIVIRYTNISISDVDILWKNLSKFQQQYPRTYAYIICGNIVDH